MTNWTKEREAAARARCDAANPATWWAGGCVVYGHTTPTEGTEVCDLAVTYSGRTPGETEANCDFIAHARTDLPDALDEIERLRQELIERGRGSCRSLGL